jgi:hypothetical protein
MGTIMDTKEDLIVSLIERWLNEKPRRSLQALTRVSGVPYPTLRRIVQKECEPSTDSAMSVLNVVATLSESLEYFSDVDPIKKFYARVSANMSKASPELIETYFDPEPFWILNLALCVGATLENVRGLLGAKGVEAFEEMVGQNLLVEKNFGVYVVNVECATVFIESKRYGRESTRNIADMASLNEALQRSIIYGVDSQTYREIEEKMMNCFLECGELAERGPGKIMAAFSFVAKQIAKGGDNDA